VRRSVCAILLLLVCCSTAWALEPDQIALVINAKMPGSLELAQFYSQQRHIPAGRIIALSIDQTNDSLPREEIRFGDYDSQVKQPIRDFLINNGLKDQVTCLVTFWGVPLRIAARESTQAQRDELAGIEKDRNELRPRAERTVDLLEALAKQISPKFAPVNQPVGEGDEPQQLANRSEAARVSAVIGLLAMPAGAQRNALVARLIDLIEQIWGKPQTILRLALPPLSQLVAIPVTPDQVSAAQQQLEQTRARLAELDPRAPGGREAEWAITRDNLGSLNELRMVENHYRLLQTDQTASALDSELALIWWGNYLRFRWVRNPLYCRYEGPSVPFPTVMVTRLDAPTLAVAHELIKSSIAVEKSGLQGQMAIDARGMLPKDAYGIYDQSLRNLAVFMRLHTKVKVTLDDRDELFAPHSVGNVAMYCGWYSLRHYVPGCVFNRGAVGFHAASFELLSLHTPGETGWVRGLLNDGVVATLGPVAEPYLESFPKPDEFFPLLLTGKLTLAEVYWRTTPMASWMQDCIGDPLYRPYAANPALAVEDLPAALRDVVGSGTSDR
jgi:uncharacterized protein (TIGR03790 family)